MKKLQVLTHVLVLVFLAFNAVTLYKLSSELRVINEKIEKIKPVIDDLTAWYSGAKRKDGGIPFQGDTLQATIEQGLRQLAGNGMTDADDPGRNRKFEAYFRRIETSDHTFHRRGRIRSARRMGEKLRSKYSSMHVFMKDDRQLLRTITQSTSEENGKILCYPYQVEINGKKRDLMEWLLEE